MTPQVAVTEKKKKKTGDLRTKQHPGRIMIRISERLMQYVLKNGKYGESYTEVLERKLGMDQE